MILSPFCVRHGGIMRRKMVFRRSSGRGRFAIHGAVLRADDDQPLVPEFGLPEVKYPYIKAD